MAKKAEQFSELLESIGATKNDMERDTVVCRSEDYRRMGASVQDHRKLSSR